MRAAAVLGRVVAGAALIVTGARHDRWWSIPLWTVGSLLLLGVLRTGRDALLVFLERLLEPDLAQLRALPPIRFQRGEGHWRVLLRGRENPAVLVAIGRSFGIELLPALRLVAGDLPKVLIDDVTRAHARELVKRIGAAGGRAKAVNAEIG